jgi:hypothetical protein
MSATWECGKCSRPESRSLGVRWTCHHCGELLCQDDRVEIPDPAFSGPLVSPQRTAVHCAECRALHHPLVPVRGPR